MPELCMRKPFHPTTTGPRKTTASKYSYSVVKLVFSWCPDGRIFIYNQQQTADRAQKQKIERSATADFRSEMYMKPAARSRVNDACFCGITTVKSLRLFPHFELQRPEGSVDPGQISEDGIHRRNQVSTSGIHDRWDIKLRMPKIISLLVQKLSRQSGSSDTWQTVSWKPVLLTISETGRY